jgi:hypothetical protein
VRDRLGGRPGAAEAGRRPALGDRLRLDVAGLPRDARRLLEAVRRALELLQREVDVAEPEVRVDRALAVAEPQPDVERLVQGRQRLERPAGPVQGLPVRRQGAADECFLAELPVERERPPLVLEGLVEPARAALHPGDAVEQLRLRLRVAQLGGEGQRALAAGARLGPPALLLVDGGGAVEHVGEQAPLPQPLGERQRRLVGAGIAGLLRPPRRLGDGEGGLRRRAQPVLGAGRAQVRDADLVAAGVLAGGRPLVVELHVDPVEAVRLGDGVGRLLALGARGAVEEQLRRPARRHQP